MENLIQHRMLKYKEFHFWERSRVLAIEIYKITNSFPSSEQFGLTSQMRRSAVSIPSNIAEGCSRSSPKDLRRFLEISIGSAFELETQLNIAFNCGFLNESEFERLQIEIEEVTKKIVKYRSRITSSHQSAHSKIQNSNSSFFSNP